MIRGFVTPEHEPVVRLTVVGPEGESLEIEALVDTGSDGFLTLPPDQIDRLQLPWLQSGRVEFADGTDVFDIHGGIVLWAGESRRILIDAMNAAPLIGMALLKEHELNIQVTAGGDVTIRPLRSAQP